MTAQLWWLQLMQTGEEVTDIFKAVGFNFPGLYRRVLFFFCQSMVAAGCWQRTRRSADCGSTPGALAPARLRKINITNQRFWSAPRESCRDWLLLSSGEHQPDRAAFSAFYCTQDCCVCNNKFQKMSRHSDGFMNYKSSHRSTSKKSSQCWLEVIPSLYLSGLRPEQICWFVALGVH